LLILPPGEGLLIGKYRVYLSEVMNEENTAITLRWEYLKDTSHIDQGINYVYIEAEEGYDAGIFLFRSPSWSRTLMLVGRIAFLIYFSIKKSRWL
jgi:hypothetical protein